MTDSPLIVTASAARRIVSAAKKHSKASDAVLRVAVQGGGCQGFSYVFSFEDSPAEDDTVVQQDDAKVIVDPSSLELLRGSRLDFVQDLMGARFQIDNPQATSSCGCGTSFSL
ncbi:MAG: iron-sulfur cluster assembly accessory protein [Alphaproteobacteria bacterium GM202ARS2]|nr:iron-sulfur cluster assembly accessory protein [Alphaproteobacteria bacterium GM202ARS2]